MKRLITLSALLTVLIGCGGSGGSDNNTNQISNEKSQAEIKNDLINKIERIDRQIRSTRSVDNQLIISRIKTNTIDDIDLDYSRSCGTNDILGQEKINEIRRDGILEGSDFVCLEKFNDKNEKIDICYGATENTIIQKDVNKEQNSLIVISDVISLNPKTVMVPGSISLTGNSGSLEGLTLANVNEIQCSDSVPVQDRQDIVGDWQARLFDVDTNLYHIERDTFEFSCTETSCSGQRFKFENIEILNDDDGNGIIYRGDMETTLGTVTDAYMLLGENGRSLVIGHCDLNETGRNFHSTCNFVTAINK